jgi:7-keto-8-aminopelargonate synthetase-like enzyme/predicted N-acyltransferase
MAKINHNNSLDTIDELFSNAKEKGIMHLEMDSNSADKYLEIGGRRMLNFGTCSYMGLELDERLRKGAMEAAWENGTLFSVSRGYLSSSINTQLEGLISEIYSCPVLVYSSTSLAHISLVPSLIRERDAIILDQQVHMSVQTAAQLTRMRGTPIEMIRHSSMEMLERKLIEYGNKFEKIWFMVDGVYSMYGDVAPIDDLLLLMKKYHRLHLYIDDAHGMSWKGKNGAGYIFDKTGIHPRIMLVTTMSKGFGAMGGIAVFPDAELHRKVKIFGGPFCYSHPLPPPMIGAAIASAKIHLSDEINVMQKELAEKIDYCTTLLNQTKLPVISNPETPIFFIGMGQTRFGYNMVKKVLNDGYYVNLSIFPTVPVKNTGLRFTITRHMEKPEIKSFVDSMEYHFEKVMQEEDTDLNQIRKAFRLPNEEKKGAGSMSGIKKKEEFHLRHETSISKIEPELWNALFADKGSFDWNGMQYIEKSYSENILQEDNWSFDYFIITDASSRPVVATFTTTGIYQDDFLSLDSVSAQIHEKRKSDRYYLTSKTIAMGSLLTEGDHLFIDRSLDWKPALRKLFAELSILQEGVNANSILLRDFDKSDMELRDFFIGEGFVKIDMPNTNIIEREIWNNEDEFLAGLSYKNRKQVRKDMIREEFQFEVEFKNEMTPAETQKFFELYKNVKDRNHAISFFPYPKKVFENLSDSPSWEILILRLNRNTHPDSPIVAMVMCYRGISQYCPMVLGLDYSFTVDYKIYKQVLYQLVKRANELNYKRIFLGLSADTDKRKVGARQIERLAFIQSRDTFNHEVIESMSANRIDYITG